MIRTVSFFKSLITALINVILKKIVGYLSHKEKHESQHNFGRSATFKVLIFTFVTTALVPLTTHWGTDEWFGSGDLVFDIYMHMLLYNLLVPFSYFFDVTYWINRVKYYIQVRRGQNSTYTQNQLNKVIEPIEFDVIEGYQDILLVLSLTVFYMPLMPLIPIFSIVGLFLYYSIQKFRLVRI